MTIFLLGNSQGKLNLQLSNIQAGFWKLLGLKFLRAHVHKNQTILKILGKCRKMDFAYILTTGSSLWETNTSILSLAEYRFVFKKIDNPWKPPYCHFRGSKFMPSFVASREKIKHSGRKIPAKYCGMTSNKYVESNFSPSCPFIYKI